jgi:hypothetical protein
MDHVSRFSLSTFAIDKAASLAELGIGAGTGGILGALQAPKGNSGAGMGRGMLTGAGTMAGVDWGKEVGRDLGQLAAAKMPGSSLLKRLLGAGAGSIPGGYIGGYGGYKLTNQAMGAPSWQQPHIKSAAMTGAGALAGGLLGRAQSPAGYHGVDTARGGLIGAGAGLGADLGGAAGGIGGGVIGKLIARLITSKLRIPDAEKEIFGIGGTLAGNQVGSLGGGVAGGVKGYHMSKNYLDKTLPHMSDQQMANDPRFNEESVKSARTKAAIAGLVVLMRDQTQGMTKSALGVGSLITGAGKMLGGRTLVGAGDLAMSTGKSMAANPHAWGAGVGAMGGGLAGSNENNSWGDTFRNMGIGAGAGTAAGHFGSKPLGQLLQRGGGALTQGMNAFGRAAQPGGMGLGARWINEGTSELNAANHYAIGGDVSPTAWGAAAGSRERVPSPGIGGWLGRNVTPGRVNAVSRWPGIIGSHTMGQNSIPWALGGAAMGATGIPMAAQAGGQQGATEAEAQMANQYQNMPTLQRLMMSLNPEAMTGQLPQAAQQRLQQLRAMAPAA